MILRGFFPLGQRLLYDHIDCAAVFRMHANQSTVLRSSLQRLEDASVVEHENPWISHEQLEAGYPFAHEVVHFRKLSARDIRHDAMKGVVANRFVRSLAHPGIERLAQWLSFVLNRKIDERRRAAECCGPGSSFKIIGAGGAPKGHIKVRVHIDSAR